MKPSHQIILVILSLFATGECAAQNLTYISGDSMGVMVYADPRVLVLTKKHAASPLGSIYVTHGFRVQIYSGGDRLKATQIKVDFMRRFPGVRTYMSYIQPQFRVKVGDYRSRAEAAVMYRSLNNIYPCMIVPDLVEINTFKNDQSNTGESK
jgi:hypothetical protein